MKKQQFALLNLPYGNGSLHPVVFADADALLLVDCGYPGALPLLEAELDAHGFDPARLTHLILTHHDFDHMGAAAALKRKYPHIRILAHELEAPYISGELEPLRLTQAKTMQDTLPEGEKEGGLAFMNLLKSVEPVVTDVLLQDGQRLPYCGGLTIVHTTGHTAGHISVVANARNVIAAGDAAVLQDGALIVANPEFAQDRSMAEASLKCLIHGFAHIPLIACCHGGLYQRPE